MKKNNPNFDKNCDYFLTGRDSTRGLKSLPPEAFLHSAERRPVRTLDLSTQNKKHTNLRLVRFSFGGEGGIRTRVRFRAN